MIRAIVFDLDGVLVDATEWHFEAFNRALQDVAGFELSGLEHETTFNGRPTKVKLEILNQQGRLDTRFFAQVNDLKQKHTANVIAERCHFNEANVAILSELSRHYSLGCYSNAIRNSVEVMLENSGALRYMKCVMSNEDTPRPKPHPDGYILIMDRLGVRPENTVIVEDSPVGINAAKESGAHVLEVLGCHDVTLPRIQDFIGRLQ